MRQFWWTVSFLAWTALPSTPVLAQVSPHQTEHCAAARCDEEAIYLAAVDTVLKDLEGHGFSGVRPPRILRTIHLSPFREAGTLSPPVDLLRPWDLSSFQRVWPGTTVVDSAQVVAASSGTLKPGGVLIVLAPVTWLGPDAARVRLAEYRQRIDYGVERYVFLEYRDRRWRVVRVEYGMQN